MTYTAVIAVRYPELDNVQNDITCFGNYLLGAQSTHGGFLPVFWDAPAAYMHAATDIGSAVDWIQSQFKLTSDENGCLAEWTTQSEGSVQSKSVTSCAGMTAHFVLLAQTKVGFLSGGRSKRMKELSHHEFLAQLEEAYARATVALTQKLCIIMGPLDMRGLMGAATVIGCLKYGAGVCGVHEDNRSVEVYLKENSIDAGPDDSAFLASLRRSLNTPRGVYPPAALAEIYCEDSRPLTRIRRLHLIVVDLDLERTRSVSKRVYREFQDVHLSADLEDCLNTLPVPITNPECPYRIRYVYAYGIDDSDRPSYLLWPRRGEGGHFWLVDPWSGRFFDPATADFLAPIGLEHFFDAFALIHKRSLRVAAAAALRIPVEDVLDNLVVKQATARAARFRLTPIWEPEEPPAKRAKKAEVSASSTHDVSMTGEEAKSEKESSEEADSDGSGSNSDFSSDDDSSEVSDLDKFEEAYTEFRGLTAGVDAAALERVVSGNTNDDVPGLVLQGGLDTLHTLANVPKSWPLARLTIPLSGFSKQLERLIEGYCVEVMVTNIRPELQLHSIKKFAKDLVLLFALHMAEKISSLLRQVLDHPTKVLYDPESEVLFLPQFWVLPIYRELLNTASRHRPSRDSELRRSASGLVKVLCKTLDSVAGGKGKRKGKLTRA